MAENVVLSGYMAGPDNAYKGHPNGGPDTSTGVLLNPKYATLAIPMEQGRTNLIPGDIVMVTNAVNGVAHRSLAWVTDVGGLPHADLDLAYSPELEKNLGVKFDIQGNSVKGLSGAGTVTVERIGNVPPAGLKNPDVVNEAILAQNAELGNKSVADIQKELQTKVKDPKYLALANEEQRKVTARGPQGGHRARKPGEAWRDEDDYTNYLADLFGDNPILGIFLIVIALMTGMLDGENASKLFNLIKDSPHAAGYREQLNYTPGQGGLQRAMPQTDPGTPGGAWGEAWNKQLTPDMEAKLKALVPEAVAKVEKLKAEGKAGFIYQEVKGSGYMSYGVDIFTDRQGNIRAIPAATGGNGAGQFPGAATGTGPGMIDPNYPKAKEIPNYTLGNFRTADERARQGLANLGAFTLDMTSNGQDDIAGTGRGAIRMHMGTNNTPKSLGCMHFSTYHAALVEDSFRGRSVELQTLVTTDKNNPLYKELEKVRPEQVKSASTAPAPTPNLPTPTPSAPTPSAPTPPKSASFTPHEGYVPTIGASNAQARVEMEKGRARAKQIDPATSEMKFTETALNARRQVLQEVAEIRAKYPEGTKFVVVDDGHGTHCGCGACVGGKKEEDVIAGFTPKLKAELEQKGYVVVSTKQLIGNKDWGGVDGGMVERATRGEIGEALDASARISVHADAGAPAEKQSTVYFFDQKGKELASAINSHMAGNGVKHDTTTAHKELGFLRIGDQPAALIELVNMTNKSDMALLNDPVAWDRWTSQKAAACASAIDEFSIANGRGAQRNSPIVTTQPTATPAKSGLVVGMGDSLMQQICGDGRALQYTQVSAGMRFMPWKEPGAENPVSLTDASGNIVSHTAPAALSSFPRVTPSAPVNLKAVDTLILNGGTNDDKYTAASVKKDLAEVIKQARAANPNVRVVLVKPESSADKSAEVAAQMRTAYDELGEEYNVAVYDPVTGNNTKSADGVHYTPDAAKDIFASASSLADNFYASNTEQELTGEKKLHALVQKHGGLSGKVTVATVKTKEEQEKEVAGIFVAHAATIQMVQEKKEEEKKPKDKDAAAAEANKALADAGVKSKDVPSEGAKTPTPAASDTNRSAGTQIA